VSDPAGHNVPEPRWQSTHGDVIARAEKLKVLRQDLDEIRQVSQDALDDSMLMGCDPGPFRAVLVEIVSTLESACATLQAPAPKEPS